VKTRELIRQLQEADPSGELECCVGNHDIHFVERWPAFYDGALQILVRDPNKSGYNIVGGIVQCSGEKVQIHTLSLEDCLFEQLDFPIEIRGADETLRRYVEDRIEKWRQNVKRELEAARGSETTRLSK
jgi:hypothetical protein